MVVSGGTAEAAVQYTFYAAPGGSGTGCSSSSPCSLTGVRDKIRTVNAGMSGDIEVFLRGGTYSLASTFALDNRDSGKNGYKVRYKAYPGEIPVLSGGTNISGWTLHDSTKNIWRATAGNIETRQFYVNGQRAVRARSTTGLPGATNSSTGHTTSWTAMASWGNLADVEFVYRQIWTQPRNLVDSISVSGGTATVTMQQPAYGYNRNKGMTSTTNPAWVENAYELLDSEGEWYLNRATDVIYYKPRPGENLASASTVAATLETLMTVEGTVDNPVENIEFYGLTFSYGAWGSHLRGIGGHPDAQGNVIRMPGAGNDRVALGNIRIKYALNTVFERNEFSRMGSNALDIQIGSQNTVVRGNRFLDIGASAVQVGDMYRGSDGTNLDNQNPSDLRKIIKNTTITNNFIDNVGVEFASAIGIFVVFADNTNMAHNVISNTTYSGLSNGWGWSDPKWTPNIAKNNKIEDNYFYRTMTTLKDGAPIYTLGYQTGGSIKRNYIHTSGTDKGALYLDEGSQNYTVQNNVSRNVGKWLFIWTTSIQNNTVTYNYADTANVTNNGTNNTVANNTIVTDGNWPQGAVDVMNSAGLEANYRDLLYNGVEIPLSRSRVADSGWSNVGWLWDGSVTTGEANEVDGEGWVEYDFGTSRHINRVRLLQDGGTYQVTDWKIQHWNGSAWLDTFGYVTSASREWQEQPVFVTTSKLRLYVRNTAAGGIVAFQEFEILGINSLLSAAFNSDTLGAAPGSWTTGTTGGTVTVADVPGSGNRSVRIAKSGTSGEATAERSFSAQSGSLIVQSQVRPEETNGWKVAPYLLDSNGAVAVSIVFENGSIKYYDGTTLTTLQGFSAGSWYDLKLVLNPATDKFDLYINGVRRLNQGNFRAAATNISKVRFGIGSGHAGSFYFDNVQVYY
jgi:hypothetical protein